MKNMKKMLAALMALTMVFGMASCGESSGSTADTGSSAESSAAAESSEESAAESSEESGEESSAAESSEESSEAAASNGAYKGFEHRTLKHEPYAISADFDLPELEGLTLTDDPTGTIYFATLSKTSYYYRKDGDMLGVDVYPSLQLIEKNNAKRSYETDKNTVLDSDNGYKIVYPNERKIYKEGTDKAQWDVTVWIYGDSYRECSPYLQIHFLADQKKMTEDEFIDFAVTVAKSVKFTVDDEDALILDDGSFKVYSHNYIVPPKVTIAGAERDAKLIFSQIYPEAFVEFDDGGIKYEITTDILTGDSRIWESTQKKTDEYTAVKVDGHDAFIKIPSYGLIGEFVVQLSEEHVEKFSISGKSYDDGSRTKDGKSFTDLQKEMTDDAHKAETINLFTGYASEFVNAWIIEDGDAAAADSAAAEEADDAEKKTEE